MIKLFVPLVASTLFAFNRIIVGVTDLSGSAVVGAVSGLAGAGILGAIGIQLMKTYRASQRWNDEQLKRYLEEIERLHKDLLEERVRSELMANQLMAYRRGDA